MLQMTKSGNRISPPPEELRGESKLPHGVEQREVKNGKAKPMALMENNECSICEAVRSGDEAAIEKAYWKSLDTITWHSSKTNGWWKRAKTSKDYAQEAWIILLTKLQTGFDCRQLPDHTFHAYVGKIAYYLYLVGERKIKRDQAALDRIIMELHEDREFDADKYDVLREVLLDRAMAQLPQEDRWIVEERAINGVSFEILASMLGKSNDAVRQQYRRARVELQKILKSMGINGTWI